MPKVTSTTKTTVIATRTLATMALTKTGKLAPSLQSAVANEERTNVSASTSTDVLKFTIDSLEDATMGSSWLAALQPEFTKPYFRKLKDFLLEEHKSQTVYPPLNDVYTWSRLTPLDQVKVVILGQDPYHDIGQAHGLSFSVLPPTKIPGSLKNIYKQIALDFPSFVIPTTGDLSPLARLGVLWLNTSLTVRAHKAGSHSKKGWETFTSQVLRAVLERHSKEGRGVVFMAWGLPAQKTCDSIEIDKGKHLILKSAHPSPLSAHRGFLGNGHFKQANEWLRERYGRGAEINWEVLTASK